MSETRAAILRRIREANGKQDGDTANITAWIQRHERGAQPRWQETRLSRFIHKLEQAGATQERVGGPEAIVRALLRFRAQHDRACPLLSAATPLLQSLTWPEEVVVERRIARGEDQIVLSEAYCGVAETGSLVLCSGKETPTTLNFLPEYFVCVLRTASLVDGIEDVWVRLREQGSIPRAVNFISGPSRTADVEQTIQMGAHGPRHVHVLLLEA